ncbi:thioredoxin-domain-containing protein [Peniophora sp. CONT]|nr:thioredoxin-domain-containing protein [Peniophora sp. CONT]
MRLNWPSTLPCSLFLAYLVLAGGASPVTATEAEPERLQLDPATFASKTTKGYWFVEHFSPWCHHCQAFMPTWDELVRDYEGSGVHLAQIDCTVNGDLCSDHKVRGYPTIIMYKDGIDIGQFQGARIREKLDDFITDKTAISLHSKNGHLVAETEASLDSASDPNPDGTVLKLTPDTFATAKSKGGLFIKFFAPWCGHCKKLAPVWEQLAREMRHQLTIAEVDCDQHKKLCNVEGVTGFPMLFFYGADGSKTEYTGSRKLEGMKGWAERAVQPAVQHISYDDFDGAVASHPVVFLYLYAPGDTSGMATLTNGARPLLGSPPVYTSSSSQFLQRFGVTPSNVPVLLAFKDHDLTSPTSVLHVSPKTTSSDLTSWLLHRRLPSALELSDNTFQEVMKAPGNPLVVLTAVPGSDNFAEHEFMAGNAAKLGVKWKKLGVQRGGSDEEGKRGVVFVWMDQGRWKKWLKSMYGITKPGEVVITDHANLLYFDHTPSGTKLALSEDSLFPTLDAALAGTLHPKHSENLLERGARRMNVFFTALEGFIIAHTFLFCIFVLMGLAGVLLLLKRIIMGDAAQYTQYEKGRID